MKRFKWFLSIATITAFACLTSYAEVKPITAKTETPFKKVWLACIDSAADVSFSVASTDKDSGLIIAEKQIGLRTTKTIRMNISVAEESGTTTIIVRYIPVQGQIGGGKQSAQYVAAVKKRINDLTIVVADK